MENKIYLAILNITSWCGLCGDATHVYGHLILSTKENVNIDNVEDWNVKYLGENIELFRPLTLEIAIALDEIDGGKTYQRHFSMINDEFCKQSETNRFDTFDQVVNAGIKKWKELNINCTFISLYEGKKYKANNYEPSSSIICKYVNN